MYCQYIRVYFYTCNLLKQKVYKMSASVNFPIMFIKVYKDWICNDSGLVLRSTQSYLLPLDINNVDSKIFVHPSHISQLYRDTHTRKKGKKTSNHEEEKIVMLRNFNSDARIQITARTLPQVPKMKSGVHIYVLKLLKEHIQRLHRILEIVLDFLLQIQIKEIVQQWLGSALFKYLRPQQSKR